jgi:hypothetical protein
MFQRVEPVHPSRNCAYHFPNIQFPRNATPKVMSVSCWAVGTSAAVVDVSATSDTASGF